WSRRSSGFPSRARRCRAASARSDSRKELIPEGRRPMWSAGRSFLLRPEPRDLSVLRAARGELTLEEEKLRELEATQGQLAVLLDEVFDGRLRAGRLEARERQVRGESAALRREAQLFHRRLNATRKLRQRRRSLDPRPKHARATRVREKAEALDLHGEFHERP